MIRFALTLAVLFVASEASAQIQAPPAGPPPEPLEVEEPFEGPAELVFISPAGEPFRAPSGHPYPVAVWFAAADKDGDGALTEAEFITDSLRFFEVLDADHDGLVDGFENADYERDIAPEIAGIMRRPRQRPRSEGGGWRPFTRADAMWGSAPMLGPSKGRSAAPVRQGAGQYGLLNEPHPVRGGDGDLDGKVSRREAEAAARKRYRLLDTDGDGRLALDDLPQTPAQIAFSEPPPDKRRKR